MSSAALEWVDAETPHAKVLRQERAPSSAGLRDADVQAAIKRIEAFQARLISESLERPLVIVGQD